MPVDLRIRVQRELLEKYMPEVDTNLFLKNNPILIREFQYSLDPKSRLRRVEKIFEEAGRGFAKTSWFRNLIKKYKK